MSVQSVSDLDYTLVPSSVRIVELNEALMHAMVRQATATKRVIAARLQHEAAVEEHAAACEAVFRASVAVMTTIEQQCVAFQVPVALVPTAERDVHLARADQ